MFSGSAHPELAAEICAALGEPLLPVRLREYHEKTDPVLELFARKEYVITVDARRSKDDVQQEIRERLQLPPYKPDNG